MVKREKELFLPVNTFEKVICEYSEISFYFANEHRKTGKVFKAAVYLKDELRRMASRFDIECEIIRNGDSSKLSDKISDLTSETFLNSDYFNESMNTVIISLPEYNKEVHSKCMEMIYNCNNKLDYAADITVTANK